MILYTLLHGFILLTFLFRPSFHFIYLSGLFSYFSSEMVLFKKKYTDIFIECETDDEFSPKIGSNHQVEIYLNPAYSKIVYDIPLSYASCLLISTTWSDSDVECFVHGVVRQVYRDGLQIFGFLLYGFLLYAQYIDCYKLSTLNYLCAIV